MRPTKIIVDLNALEHNIYELKGSLRQECRFMAVVKANAYGHGIVEVAHTAVRAGAFALGVAVPEEGVLLRQSGITAPILVLGAILDDMADDVVQNGLSQTVFCIKTLYALEKAARRLQKKARVHIKVDTGMNRIGLSGLAELNALLDAIDALDHVELEGLFTHFAVSEIEDKSFTRNQFLKFKPYREAVLARGLSPLAHCCNSGGMLDLSGEMQLDMVRVGLAMYGYSPGPGCGAWARLKPVLSWETVAMQVKNIAPGDTVSYGRIYTADGPRQIMTMPVGYGDGYKCAMSGKAQVLVKGRRVPVIGRICMDQCMADVTGLDVAVGEKVVLLGEQGGNSISANDLANWAGTINYEIPLSITDRVARCFVPVKRV